MKVCTKCGETKLLGAFAKCKAKQDGHYPYCKECGKEVSRAWRAANPGKTAGYNAAGRARHPERGDQNNRKGRAELAPAYVACGLGLSVKQLTPELLALRREQILNLRALRALNKTLKGINHGK